ncbi:glycosyl hydrolase [Catalinimonas sp. 4WD22]|uniref:VPS10 domain-containing protein n=1 Tax=Catalinimonas locisalis TaxID=3133978 RepID=UPI0031018000
MRTFLHYTTALLLCLLLFHPLMSQRNRANSSSEVPMSASTFEGLELRNIGPAFMSGRIADLAIHPEDPSIWYIAVGSGGVWKTVNAGTTFEPIFDEQDSYSIGCVSIDPSDPDIIWVGTGENVGGRHVGYGDGAYRSEDGGQTWQNMGLPNSEHISKIIVHPENSDIVWVAAQGPLWNKGGERGLYKTTDGGKSWTKKLGDDAWTGVTDLLIDPRNPDQLYAATWQRHRTVAAYMGGGPGTGIYRSTDGGESWEELTNGLPESDMGKIGLAISPQQPDIVYAAIELDRGTGGIYRSADRGSSWEKRSDVVSGGTGPHYYQELYASPHHFERIYLADATMQVSDDGGKTFTDLNTQFRHGDNHALTFKKDDPDYLMIGTDGGVYESFDLGKTWRYMQNLPLTQFYKIALDDTEPFYKIYGGTQDNGSQGGPSRTDNVQGIQNSDWKLVLNWDGHQPATEPGNPNIVYAERQQGALSRLDMKTGEVIDIQPQPRADEDYERFNWDAPILVSPHDPASIYFASQRVWKSDNRGDEWEAISGDLTKDQERIELPIMDKTQSWDAAWDVGAMSNYNTITSLAESPVQEGIVYAGTDDGIVQVTEDGGQNWRRIDVGSMPGVPATAFVNDIKADLHDANTVYVALDNHKYGDFSPYLMKSTDRGKSWQSIRGNLPDRTLVWRLVQDHVKPELMFAATEFGVYFTVDGGQRWVKLEGGVPTISFRDLAIHKRENDLVAASFGRGIFILDDYTALRGVSDQQLMAEATLFPARKALWYIPRSDIDFEDKKGSLGDAHFVAPNPDFGTIFTYYLKDGLKTREEVRVEKEKALKQENQDIPFPGWEAVEGERREQAPQILLTIQDTNGNTVRRIEGPVTSGFHRIAWDLRYPAPEPLQMDSEAGESQGMMAAPGTYTASLSKKVDGEVTTLSEPITFEVEPLYDGTLEGAPAGQVAEFWREYEGTYRAVSAVGVSLDNALTKAERLQLALERSTTAPGEFDAQMYNLQQSLMDLDEELNGNRAKQEIGEKTKPTISERLFAVERGISHSTYGPTPTHQQSLAIVKEQLQDIQNKLKSAQSEMAEISAELMENGAPWIEGEALPPVGPEKN